HMQHRDHKQPDGQHRNAVFNEELHVTFPGRLLLMVLTPIIRLSKGPALRALTTDASDLADFHGEEPRRNNWRLRKEPRMKRGWTRIHQRHTERLPATPSNNRFDF